MQDERNVIKKKINFFLAKGVNVHITKKNGLFLNGQFLKNLGGSIYSFMERKLGIIEVFLDEIEDIERYVKEEVKTEDESEGNI